MTTSKIDTIAAKLATTAPRRRALGWLAAAAGAGLIAAAPATEVGARKRKEKKRKPKVCKPGKRFASVLVPARGGAVLTPVLKKDQRYIMRVTGAWSTNQQHGCDAFATFRYDAPATPIKEYRGVRLGLTVNNQTPDAWVYNPNHVYQRLFIGTGAPLALAHQDPEEGDNSGAILAEIFCD